MKPNPKLEPIIFGAILSGFMSAIVSCVTLIRAAGFIDGFVGVWFYAWLSAWAVAFPAVLFFAPLARRAVGRLFKG